MDSAAGGDSDLGLDVVVTDCAFRSQGDRLQDIPFGDCEPET